MRGSLQVNQCQCPVCRALTKTERSSMVWGFGDLLLIVVTPFALAKWGGVDAGIAIFVALAWIPMKFAWNALANPWRCTVCGSRA